eukprot:2823384-Pleurochrysis_carterae.AAC.1
MKKSSSAKFAGWLSSARSLAKSRGVGFCSRGWRNYREGSLIKLTTTPESSVRRLRGAPASVVERQRSGSNLRGVAP